MAVSATFSRLNLLPRPSLPYALSTLRVLKFRPMWAPLTSFSAHFSTPKSSPIPNTQIPRAPDDDFIVLGIETSCDDTAAAVVSCRRILIPLLWLYHGYLIVWSFVVSLMGFGWFLCLVFFRGVLGEEQWGDSQPSCVFSGIMFDVYWI
jgi:hypothetical protein